MRGTSGYARLWDPTFYGGHPKEADTYSCNHCNKIVHVKPMAPLDDLGGRCGACDALICKDCLQKSYTHGCDVFEEKLKRMEAKGAAIASYGLQR